MPRERATREQVKERIELAEAMIETRRTTSEIKREFKTRFGLRWRQVQNFIARARRNLLRRSHIDLDTERFLAHSFYSSLVVNERMPPLVRLKSQERLDRLLGLEQPQRHRVETAQSADPRDPDYNAVLDRIFERQHAPQSAPVETASSDGSLNGHPH